MPKSNTVSQTAKAQITLEKLTKRKLNIKKGILNLFYIVGGYSNGYFFDYVDSNTDNNDNYINNNYNNNFK